MASAQLRDTKRRITSVEATKKITRAMELIAASRIPKAQARVEGSKPYTAKLIEVIENVGAAGAGDHQLLERRDQQQIGLLIVSSDRGLAGAYASNIIRMAETRIHELTKDGKDVLIYAVGKKAQAYFRYRDYQIENAYIGVTDTPGYGDARAIANLVMEHYAVGRIDALEALYTRFESAFTQTPAHVELLPITPPEFHGEDDETVSVSYGFEPSPEEILDRLLPRYVEAIIFNMLLEASASEHSARRRAMKAATDNAEELIKTLTVQANRARQAEITTAITEIVGGAEALADA